MGKITEVYYEEIDPKVCDVRTAGEFYYNYNLIGVHNMFHDDYEGAEIKQLYLRNRILGEAKQRGDIQQIKTDSAMLAISSLKNKVVLVVNK